jgi:hypothetical protein
MIIEKITSDFAWIDLPLEWKILVLENLNYLIKTLDNRFLNNWSDDFDAIYMRTKSATVIQMDDELIQRKCIELRNLVFDEFKATRSVRIAI